MTSTVRFGFETTNMLIRQMGDSHVVSKQQLLLSIIVPVVILTLEAKWLILAPCCVG